MYYRVTLVQTITMKKNCLLVSLLVISCHNIYAQGVSSAGTQGLASAGNMPISLADVNSKIITTIKSPDAIGSPYLCEEWNTGNVTFKNGKKADSFKLRFDAETNTLQFLHKEMTLAFVDPVQEFKFNYNEGNTRKEAFFRSGYPETDKHSTSALYQVLAEGTRIQLLQYNEKHGQNFQEYSGPVKTKYVTWETLYLYDIAAKTMRKIKCRKSAVIDALPALETSINKLCETNKWTLKNTEELTLLVAQLQ
jgi:hypothetical protein